MPDPINPVEALIATMDPVYFPGVVGTYPIASNVSYPAANGRVLPKGRYLRASASNGGCAIALDLA